MNTRLYYIYIVLSLVTVLAVAQAEPSKGIRERLVANFLASTPVPSYGVLALQNVAGPFSQAVSLLSNLTNASVPDSVKTTRKSLLTARNGLDIFAYAYPKTREGKAKVDTFQSLRGDLDKGYTLIGDFQDLKVVNFTQKELKARLDLCLTWKTSFLTNMAKLNYKAYVLSATTSKIINRKKSGLSKDYWAYVNATPSTMLNGYQNLAILGEGQDVLGVNYFDATYNLTDIWDKKYNTMFHDYRKLLRAISYVGVTFPMIYQGNVTDLVGLVTAAYGKFGDLHDLVVELNQTNYLEYEYYVDKGNQKSADGVKAQIVTSWAALKSWLDSKSFRVSMQTLSTQLIPHKI